MENQEFGNTRESNRADQSKALNNMEYNEDKSGRGYNQLNPNAGNYDSLSDKEDTNNNSDIDDSNQVDSNQTEINSYDPNIPEEENRENTLDINPDEQESDKENQDANLEECPERDQTQERQNPNSENSSL